MKFATTFQCYDSYFKQSIETIHKFYVVNLKIFQRQISVSIVDGKFNAMNDVT